MAQYLKYPTKVMNITQDYDDDYSHKVESTGNPKSYPIDDNCGTSGRSYFYAPCDVKIKRIYGVGNKGINTIWMESTKKVKLANGTESYVTIRVTHPGDDDLKKIKVGKTYKQGCEMFREGKDGNCTGYHFHIEISNCQFSKLKNNGWVKNSNDAWVTAPNSIKPEQAFYVDNNFTKIKCSKGLKFKEMPTKQYFKKYNGNSNSLIKALKTLGYSSSFSYRAKIAKENGIKLFLGTSSQNTKLLKLLKQGKLIKP